MVCLRAVSLQMCCCLLNYCRKRKVVLSYIWWSIILIAFPLVQLLYRLSAAVIKTKSLFENTGVICDVLLIFTYIFTIGGAFAAFWNSDDEHGLNRNVDDNNRVSSSEQLVNREGYQTFSGSSPSSGNSQDVPQLSSGPRSSHPTDKHPIIPKVLLFILGCGDALFNVTRFGDQLLIIITNGYVSDGCRTKINFSITENFFRCISQLVILFFMLYHEKIKAQSSPFIRAFIRVLPLSIACEWLMILMQEVDKHLRHYDDCIKHDWVKPYSFNSTEDYLYPLGTEFRSFALMELLIIMIKVCPWTKKQAPSNKPLISRRESDTHHSRWNLPGAKIIGGTIGVLVVIFSITFIFFQESYYEEEKSEIILISEISEVILVSVLFILSIVTVLWKSNTPKTEYNSREKIELWALFIAWLAVETYCVLTFIGAVKYQATTHIGRTTKIMTIFASSISAFQSLLQFILIIRVTARKQFLSEKWLQSWIMISFAMWLFDSFSAKKYSTNTIQLESYGKTTWTTLGAIFIPPAIFFRFHSCIMFANMDKN